MSESATSGTSQSQPSRDGIDEWVRAILRCPVCRSPLVDANDGTGAAQLWCDGSLDAGCRRQYRIDDGIPVLLAEEAVHPYAEAGDGSGAT